MQPRNTSPGTAFDLLHRCLLVSSRKSPWSSPLTKYFHSQVISSSFMAFNTIQHSEPLNVHLSTSVLHSRLVYPTAGLTTPLEYLKNISNWTCCKLNYYRIIDFGLSLPPLHIPDLFLLKFSQFLLIETPAFSHLDQKNLEFAHDFNFSFLLHI